MRARPILRAGITLREYLPLEQGLRPNNLNIVYAILDTQRVSSIRTRIKTATRTRR